MDLADSELEISTESVLHRIRRQGFFLSLINVHKMRYRLTSYRLWKTFQPIDAGYQDIIKPPVLPSGRDTRPELSPFGLRQPQARQLFFSVAIDSLRQINRFVLHAAGFTAADH